MTIEYKLIYLQRRPRCHAAVWIWAIIIDGKIEGYTDNPEGLL